MLAREILRDEAAASRVGVPTSVVNSRSRFRAAAGAPRVPDSQKSA
jgi:hypothetical protein